VLGDRLFEPVQIIGGAHTRAIIHRPTDTFNPGDQFLLPKLSARVRSESLVAVGQVLLLTGGGHYLVGTHSDEVPGWKTFVLLRCDRQVDWQSGTTIEDGLTGLDKASTPADMGSMWVYWERQLQARQDTQVRIPDVEYLVATGAAVRQGDTLDGKTVVRTETALGLTVCGVRA
jgi:hypothetical protein